MIKNSFLWIAIVFLFSSAALAAQITQVKNNQVLISLEGESASAGSEFFATNAQGKKVAIIRITKVKGEKALGEITKGSARPGYAVLPRGDSSTAAGEGTSDSYYDQKLDQRNHTGNSFGVLGGYLMNSMNATFTAGTPLTSTRVTAAMAGSGFGALGFYDYMFSPTLSLRGVSGFEQYKVSGGIATADCAGTTTCIVDLNYLSFYGYGRWVFLPGKYKTWVGGGFGYLYAIGKASTVLRQDQISANQIFVVSVGTDIRLNAKNYIPVSVEYGLFPSSESVKASIIYLRAGYAWNL